MVQRIGEIRSYLGEACEAVDAQFKVIGQAADAVRGERRPVPHQRVEEADRQWGGVLARRVVSAGPNVQRALTAFDLARSSATTAINGRNEQEISAALAQIERTRRDVLRAIGGDQHAINEELAPLVLSRWEYWWRSLRRKRLSPTPTESIDDDG